MIEWKDESELESLEAGKRGRKPPAISNLLFVHQLDSKDQASTFLWP